MLPQELHPMPPEIQSQPPGRQSMLRTWSSDYEALAGPVHIGKEGNVFNTETINYDVTMNVAAVVMTIWVGTDQSLMSGKMFHVFQFLEIYFILFHNAQSLQCLYIPIYKIFDGNVVKKIMNHGIIFFPHWQGFAKRFSRADISIFVQTCNCCQRAFCNL